MSFTIRTAIAAILAPALTLNLCAATAIGTASARGAFTIDHARVEQTTVFEGSSITTGAAASEITLKAGTRVMLAPGSEAAVYRDRLVLDKGQAQIDSSSTYGVEAAGLQIESAQQPATARLSRSGATIQFASLHGVFTIRDLQGRVLANAKAGENLQLTAAPTANSTAVSLTGKVSQVNGKWLLTDETTKTTVELRGEQVRSLVGKRVKVTGSTTVETPAPGATRVVEVSSIHVAAAGVSTTAVIAGVVVASGAGIGLGVGLTSEDPKPSASR